MRGFQREALASDLSAAGMRDRWLAPRVREIRCPAACGMTDLVDTFARRWTSSAAGRSQLHALVSVATRQRKKVEVLGHDA